MNENHVIERARNGDQDAIECLLEEYCGLIYSQARKYWVRGYDDDDMFQECQIAFLDAVKNYRPEIGVKFSSFAAFVIRRRMVTLIVQSQRVKRVALNEAKRLESDIYEDKKRMIDKIQSSDPDPEDLVIFRETLERVFNAIKESFSEFEFHVFSMYLSGVTYEEMSQKIGCKYKSVDNALSRCREKLKKVKSEVLAQ